MPKVHNKHSILDHYLYFVFVLFAFLAAVSQTTAQSKPLYQNPKAPIELRVRDLFERLTLDEKITLLTGTDFTTQPIQRLGIRAMGMVDAGQGVRGGTSTTQGAATLFPAGVMMASSWDPELIRRIGGAIGEEALNKGTGAQVLLGPAVNIQRSPLGGRNGEYFSEDPFLSARLGVSYIQGMQSTGVAACIKHYACNNEEADRNDVNVRVDERTLREIYLPAFEAAVKEGHVWTVMSAYNQINGHHATANPYLLTDVLKKGWGYDGMVMSDWGAVHETVGVINAGNDLEMPGPGYLAHDKVALALKQGRITQTTIDDHVKRILRTLIRVDLLDAPHQPDPSMVNSLAHQKLTFEAASKAIILLKNDGAMLPLDSARIHSIAVIGPAAAEMQFGAAGSPNVQPFYSISPLDGIRKRAGDAVTVTYARGEDGDTPVPASALTDLHGEYFANRDLEGSPVFTRTDSQIRFDWNTSSPAPDIPRTNFSVRWTGKLIAPSTGHYLFSLAADDGSRLYLDDRQLLNHWFESAGAAQTAEADLIAGHVYNFKVEYFQATGNSFVRLNWTVPGVPRFQDATEAARKSDVAIVCVSTAGTEGEGSDRPSMALPGAQDSLIEAVVAANPKTIVVLNNGTPCLMTRWLSKVPALLEAWFPGQEGGHALAAILFGDVDPSGKLPTTLAARREDYPDYGHFPGTKGHVDYAEGIYVGYRHFDKQHIAPLFPFGYGLSYTTFKYGLLKLSRAALSPSGTNTASLSITNTGHREGAEVAELYVHDLHPKIDKPVRELKGFIKVNLMPGETRSVSFTLAPRALAYCDVPGKQWKADSGVYELEVGASSRDIRQRALLHLTSNFTEPIPFLGADAPQLTPKDLAAGHSVKVSSVEKPETLPENAVDGDDTTRWSSQFSDPQWIAVDLGKPVIIDHIKLNWEGAYAAAYGIQVSMDGQAWQEVYATEDGQGGVEQITFTPVCARWVRMYGRKRATQFGYSLFSFGVYAPHV